MSFEKILRTKEIEQRHDRLCNEARLHYEGEELEDTLDKIGAEMDLEIQLMDEEVNKICNQKAAELRQSKEHSFFSERKALNEKHAENKKAAIRAVMSKFSDNSVVQELGRKMLTQIDQELDEEIEYLEKERNAVLEKARMQQIADNEEELKILQANLNNAVAAEEEKIDAQLAERREKIMQMKRTNLEDRLRLFAGEMSEQQVKELRDQYQRELDKLEKAIRTEKEQQLNKMRTAMLSKRIEKEQRRKKMERDQDELTRRQSVAKMNGRTAKAFREMIRRRMDGLDINKSRKEFADSDRLRQMLAQWNQKVSQTRNLRGDEGDIIQAHAIKAERDRLNQIAKAEALAKKGKGMDFTIHELYRRILKVERLSERVRNLGYAPHNVNILDELKSLNQI